tara:strand:- start:1106 stop:2146 length:1041 start_codon:yes stop_codon:yes gene_type:complete
MVASKQNDILTLLNLACIKHTGCSLPVSEGCANNWKYELEWKEEYFSDGEVQRRWRKKKAKWSPHPYFNPIHLYYPSYDFGARVLRSLLVAEFDFLLNGERKLREQILKLSNPFNYPNKPKQIGCGTTIGGFPDLGSKAGSREYKDDVITFQLHFTGAFHSRFDGKASKIKGKFLEDYIPSLNDFPQVCGTSRNTWNKHHPRTIAMDREIFKNKCNRIRWRDRLDVWTKKGALRKSDSIVEDIFDARMLAIGMSSTSEYLYFVGYKVTYSQVSECLMYWRWKGFSYHQLLKGQYRPSGYAYRQVLIDKTPLTPEDYIEIFGEKKEGQRKEKIDKALIANFPLTQSD